jgi:SnoaL-like domain
MSEMMPSAMGLVLRSPHGNGRAFEGRTMTLTRQHVREVLDTYIRAWETQDPGLIVTIFTSEATYHERVLADPIPDREAIREYWETKVVRDQANIRCTLLNFYVDGDTAIAEWVAQFDDLAQGVRKRMREVAILEFDGPLIASLREYWASERIGEPGAVPGQLGP